MTDSDVLLKLVLGLLTFDASRSTVCSPAETGTTTLVEQFSSLLTPWVALSSISLVEPGAIALSTSIKHPTKVSDSKTLKRSEPAVITRKPDARALIVVVATVPSVPAARGLTPLKDETRT